MGRKQRVSLTPLYRFSENANFGRNYRVPTWRTTHRLTTLSMYTKLLLIFIISHFPSSLRLSLSIPNLKLPYCLPAPLSAPSTSSGQLQKTNWEAMLSPTQTHRHCGLAILGEFPPDNSNLKKNLHSHFIGLLPHPSGDTTVFLKKGLQKQFVGCRPHVGKGCSVARLMDLSGPISCPNPSASIIPIGFLSQKSICLMLSRQAYRVIHLNTYP